MPESLPTVRRSVIVVGLKDPFIEWIFNVRRAHYGDSQINLENIRKRAAVRKNAYLLPAVSPGGASEFVKEHHAAIFENELKDWCLREGLWPADRSWDVFRDWLAYEFHPLVYDVFPGEGLEESPGAA